MMSVDKYGFLKDLVVDSDTYKQRMKQCRTCSEINKLKMCGQCGCFIPAKTRHKQSTCPLGKW